MRSRVRRQSINIWAGNILPGNILAGLLAAGLLIVAESPRSAIGEDLGPSDVPVGTMAFFSPDTATCPPGYRAATEASGRLIVGVNSGDSVGKLVGMPLASEEDRTHQHAFTATVTLPYKSIAALDGTNNQGAAAKTYMDSGMSAGAASGLPFIQLLACVKK